MLTDVGKFWVKISLILLLHITIIFAIVWFFNITVVSAVVFAGMMILTHTATESTLYVQHQFRVSQLLNIAGVDAVAVSKFKWRWYESPKYYVFYKNASSEFKMEDLIDIENKFAIDTTAWQHQGRPIESIVNGWKIYRK